MGANIEDKEQHKNFRKGKGKAEVMEDSVTKNKRDKADNEGDPSVILEAGGTTMKERHKKKKPKDGAPPSDAVDVNLLQDGESGFAPKKEKRKRKRDIEDRETQPGTDSPPAKKPKAKQDDEPRQVKKRKDRKSATVADPQPQPAGTSKKKKRKNKTGFPNPDDEEDNASISSQARKALAYAFSQFHNPKEWKFNKARQNWLVRNFWSIQAIPEKYEDLVVKYLSAVQGNTRENLIKTCQSTVEKFSSASKVPEKPDAKEDKNIGGALIDASSPVLSKQDDREHTRAKLLLQALTPAVGSPSSVSS